MIMTYQSAKQIILITVISLMVSACRFDTSPWETDVSCDILNLETNLQWLADIEQQSPDNSTFKAAVIGDPQQFPGDMQRTIEKINQMNDVDFILLLGDLAETGVAQEFEWTCKAASGSDKPIFAVIGNHDGLAYGPVIWLDTIGPYDYAFTYKNTKFIAYNDNKYEFENVPDMPWLEQQAKVAENETRNHTIGMSHIEPWDNEPTLTDQLSAFGFDHMLHAHNHKFAYWQKAGVELPHFITADTQDVKFGIITVTPEQISIQQCSPNCSPAELQVR